MTRTDFRLGAALALVFAVAATASLAAQERAARGSQKRPEAGEEAEHSIPGSSVPAAVKTAFRQAFPNARVNKFSSEVEGGKTVYEIESVEGNVHRDLLVSAEGTILEVETQVALADLPAAVRAAATAHGAHVTLAERVVAGHDTTYEFKIQGRQSALKLLPNGRPAPAEPAERP